MANNAYTACLLIVDRSSSMSSIKQNVEASLAQLIRDQGSLPGRISFDVIYFNEQFSYPTKFATPGSTVIRINPDGGTALYDAIVRGTQEFAQNIERLAPANRPKFVQVVVATDGEENRSRHADALLVRDTIAFHKDTFGWDFTFVGSDERGIEDAARLGFEGKKTMKFANSAAGVAGMSSGLSDYMRQTRSGQDAGYDDSARTKAAAGH